MARGGRRPGAGRKPGSLSKAKVALRDAAREFTWTALQTLVEIAEKGELEAARVSAANAILDRAHGKPTQSIEHELPDGVKFIIENSPPLRPE